MDPGPRSSPSPAAAGPSRRLRELRAEPDAGFVLSWLIRLVIALVIVGILLFEAGSVLLSKIAVSDTAAKAAEEAGFEYRDTGDVNRAQAVAQEVAADAGCELLGLTINAQAGNTTATVRKKAKTLFIQYIGPLRKYVTATATEITPLPS